MTLAEHLRRSVEDAVTAQPVDGVRLLHEVDARRARRRTRRRVRTAVLVSAASVAVLAGSSALLSPDRPAPPPATSSAVETRAYDVVLGTRSPATRVAFDACRGLPGAAAASTAPTLQRQPGEVAARVVVTGRRHFAAFAACLEQVPEAFVARTTTTPAVAMPGVPGHPEDVQSAEVCRPSEAHACRAVPRDEAVALARLLAAAAPLRGEAACDDTTWTVAFDPQPAGRQPVVNRLGCGVVEVDGQRWRADRALVDAVRREHAAPGREVVTLTDQCVGSDRPEVERDYVGLSTERATSLARSRGLSVLVLGEGGCRTGQVPYAPDRVVLVVDRGRVVWAAPG